MINETGSRHEREFTWQLSLGEFTTTGTGRSKKAAKTEASEKMFAMLPEQWSQKVKEQNLKKQKHQEGMKRQGSKILQPFPIIYFPIAKPPQAIAVFNRFRNENLLASS